MARKFVRTMDFPVVQTAAGRLRGYQLDDIFIFKGVRYAQADRWQAPRPVEPWEGVLSADSYGYVCPTNGQPHPMNEVETPHRYWPENEDCLNLNIWTPHLDETARRPVLVWFHGGGYSDGSSIEQKCYNGFNLAAYGDVVVVTVNTRLNILGFLDMSPYGEQFRNSANAGVADLVASLQWVHDNIAAFGGDPGNVTIFGQSGGGGKVCTLLQTPAAEGLFHRAVMQSGGASLLFRGDDDHAPFIEGMLEELQIPASEAARLAKVPLSVLYKAYNRTCVKLQRAAAWAPRAGDYYLGHPLEVGFTEFAKTVPTMVTTVYGEFLGFMGDPFPRGYQPTEEEKLAKIREAFGAHTDEAIAAFRKAYPGKDLRRLLQAEQNSRPGVLDFMNLRAAAGGAKAYNAMLTLEFELDGGVVAWHCSDIPFWFHNSELAPVANIGGGVTEQVEDAMAGSLVAFAYSGDPNHAGMAKWEPYTVDNHATMHFDRVTACYSGADEDFLRIWKEHGPAPKPFGIPFRIPDSETEEVSRAWLY